MTLVSIWFDAIRAHITDYSYPQRSLPSAFPKKKQCRLSARCVILHPMLWVCKRRMKRVS